MQNVAELYKKANEKPTSSSSFTSNICQICRRCRCYIERPHCRV